MHIATFVRSNSSLMYSRILFLRNLLTLSQTITSSQESNPYIQHCLEPMRASRSSIVPGKADGLPAASVLNLCIHYGQSDAGGRRTMACILHSASWNMASIPSFWKHCDNNAIHHRRAIEHDHTVACICIY